MKSLKVVKFAGEDSEIIGEMLDSPEGKVVMRNPCKVMVGHTQQGPQVALLPLLMLSKKDVLAFEGEVSYSYPPIDKLEENYNQMFSSVIMPQSNKIIV